MAQLYHKRYLSNLGIPVDVVFEVVVLAEDGLGDDVVKVDADGGHEGRTLSLRQPGHLLRLLVVGVTQVRVSLNGGHLTVSPGHRIEYSNYMCKNRWIDG